MLVIIGRANWTGLKYFLTGREYDLKPEHVQALADHLLADNYVGLGYRSTHLTSYFILFIHWKITGKWIKWSHAWINTDDEEKDPFNLTIWESVAEGVRAAKFWQVLLVDRVCLLKPKYLKAEQWKAITDQLHHDLGKKYDCKGDETNQVEVNCIEEVVFAMLAVDHNCLPGTVALMDKHRLLTPQMLIASGDFDLIVEF